MSCCNDNKSNRFQWGVILGILAGIGMGMALAPQKGDKTREKVKSEYEKYKQQAKGYISELRGFQAEQMPEVKAKVKKATTRIKAKVADLSETTKQEFSDAKELIAKRLAEKQVKE
jgi:gas vesicle protein